jgi:hypothetical protein
MDGAVALWDTGSGVNQFPEQEERLDNKVVIRYLASRFNSTRYFFAVCHADETIIRDNC